jgi:hypothetical protein
MERNARGGTKWGLPLKIGHFTWYKYRGALLLHFKKPHKILQGYYLGILGG